MKKFLTYENTDKFIDNMTGEVTSQVHRKVLRLEQNPEKFFKLFIESMGSLYGLSKASSFKVLFAILNMATNRENVVCLAFGMKSNICESIDIHLNVFKRALDELVEKEIFIKTEKKDYWLLNPHIFGQGSFIDIERLRQKVEFEYDFKKGEIQKIISADSITSVGMGILNNPHKYEVVNSTKEENDKASNIEVVVKHKGDIENNEVHPNQLSLPFALNSESKEPQNGDKEEGFDFLAQSFEITNKMLDRVKTLESNGKQNEALSFQKSLENYLNSISKKLERSK